MGADSMKLKISAALFVALIVLVANAGGAMAGDACTPDADGCITVNSNLDANVRDEALTLREALLLTSGELGVADLTYAEAGQVSGGVVGTDGEIAVYFDSDVFCVGCKSSVITLAPPGLGGPAVDSPPGLGGPATYAYNGDKLLAMPPGLGGPAMSPPGLGGPARIGMGIENGIEVPASVVIDGSHLTPEYTGMWSFGDTWLRGVHFQGFAGHALEVEASAVAGLLIGSNGDGVNDRAEAVTFSGNGGDVVVVGK